MSSPAPSDLAVPGTPLKRKIAAILAADVAGYSRLVAEDEERTLRDLAAARDVFDGMVGRAGGRIFNTAGDSVMCEFDSAVEAVRVAVDIQDALGNRNAGIEPGRRLAFRIGISIGDVVERNGDLLGDGVNLAARLESLAPIGGVCVSRSVHEAVANKLSVSFRDLGARPVKNFPQPVHAFAIDPATASGNTPRIVPGPRPTVVDAEVTFVGRDRSVRTAERRRRSFPFRPLVVAALIVAFIFFGLPLLKAGRARLDAWLAPPTGQAALPSRAIPVETVAPPQTPTQPAPAQPGTPPRTATPAKPPAAPAERAALPAEPAAAFAALARDGVVPDARSLPELYHNARVQEAKPDRAAAQKSYAAAVPLAGDLVDPVWRYAAFLRARNADGARKTLGDLARNAPSRAARLLAAASAEPTGQAAAIEGFAAANPDYAPADYLLAEAYLARGGGPTLTDRRLAFDALDRFLDAAPQLPAFFVDRAVLDGWLDGARKRRGEIEGFFVRAARPAATFARIEAGWIARFTLPEPATVITVQVGEKGGSLLPASSSDKPVTAAEIVLPAATGRETLYVAYRDGAGHEAGPFPVVFDPAAAGVAAARDTLERFPESWIQFRADLPGVISYAQLVANRCAIGRALIGFGGEPPTKAIPLPGCGPAEGARATDARSVLELPPGTETVQVQLAYQDGTESTVRTFQRP